MDVLGRFRPVRPVGILSRSLTAKGRQIIAEWKRFRQDARTLYREFVRLGDLCFDVGAHYGERIEIFQMLGRGWWRWSQT